MSDKTIIILALIGLVIPILNWLTTRRATKAAENAATTAVITSNKLDQVATNVDGKLKDLVRATGAEKLAEGVAAGRQAAIDETAERLAIRERGEDRAAGTAASHDPMNLLQGVIEAAVAKAISDSGGFPKADLPPSKETLNDL